MAETLAVAVPRLAAGERLDRFLAGVEEVGSRTAAERLLEEGKVLVDGAVRPKSHRLAGGERVVVSVERRETGLVPEDLGLRVAYEDEHLLVVDKAAGLVVHPSAGHTTGTLVHGLLAHAIAGGAVSERPGIVHRLDRDTSGLLVVARSEEAHRRLQRLIRRREVMREYLALVRGRPRSRAGRIEAPVGRDARDPALISLDTHTPREAITHFEAVELMREHALLLVRLETGRTHQIRVHLAAIELPVASSSMRRGWPSSIPSAARSWRSSRLFRPSSGRRSNGPGARPLDEGPRGRRRLGRRAKEGGMPHYLVQVAYTPAAWAGLVKKPQNRIRAVKPTVERLGGKIRGGWLSFGDYDVVAVVEMPDNVSAAAFSIAVSAGGAVKAISTTPLMTVEEGVEAMEKAGGAGYKAPEG